MTRSHDTSPGYVELHAHSAFSFLDGASMPHELAAMALELGYDTLAVTDHDSLSGALEFGHAARAIGLRPITGAEVTVIDDAHELRHATLIVRTRDGYRNLCRLLTAAYAPRASAPASSGARRRRTQASGRPQLSPSRPPGGEDRPEPRVTIEELCAHGEGLTILTGCARSGLLCHHAVAGHLSVATQLVTRLRDAFGPEHVYVELQVIDQQGDARRNRALMEIARAAGAPLVATGDVHAHTRLRARLHDVLVATRLNVPLDACEAQRFGNLAPVLRSPAQMAARFAFAPDAVAGSARIAESVEFDITSDLGYRYPDGPDGQVGDASRQLSEVCRDALETRYAGRASYADASTRLDRELTIIDRHSLSGFFLLHRDVLELARQVALEIRGADSARSLLPPGRGRGSSVESIVCYLTGLSHVDPIERGLGLGRFLNEDLNSVPDIDLDFPRDIRHELLRRVVTRYGADRCAMVAAHATYRTRGAIRDVGRALGLPPAELQRIARRCETSWDARCIADAVDRPGRAWDVFRILTGEIADLPRQIGQHSGGVVISTDPLCDLVPIQPSAMPGRQICQWDKDSCQDAGFLKIDVLGLGMLSAVEETVEAIHHCTGQVVDLSRVDYDDAAVFAQIQEGDTVGTFQIESRAQMASVVRTRPQDMHDLAVQVALIRPGPVVGQSVNPYIEARKRLRKDPDAPIAYDHPLLEPVLKETLGAIIFQDQVIEVAMALAGFTAGEADGLRRAMTRKRSAQGLASYRDRFVAGAIGKGVDTDVATRVFDRVIGFSQYGFPRAHAAAFAVLAYQSAWLRHHYPAWWYASMLNAEPLGFYPPDSLMRDAARHDVEGLGVDVNESRTLCFAPHAAGVRIGLAYVAGLSFEEACALEKERGRGGAFADIADLARRAPLRDDQLERLVASGAADSLGESRRAILWQLGTVARPQHLGTPGGGGLQEPLDLEAPDAPELRQLSLFELVDADFTHTGLSVRAHPIELLRPLLPERILCVMDARDARTGCTVEVVGAAIVVQRPHTAKGVVFIVLEDETGTLNIVVRPDLASESRQMLRSHRLLRITGRIERRDGVVNLVATALNPLPRDLVSRVPQPGRTKVFR